MARIFAAAVALVVGAALWAPKLCGEAGAAGPDSPDELFKSANLHYQSGQFAVAQRELEDLARRLPPSFQVEELLGLVYSQEKKDQLANRAFGEAVKLDPKSAAARANLAVSLSRIGKSDLAEAEFKKALRLDPNSFDANRDFGNFYLGAGKLTTAIPYLEKAERINPSSYENGYNLALAYQETSDYDRARQEINDLLSKKDTAELHNLLGEVEEKSGHYVNAEEEYQQAAHRDPSEDNIFDWGTEFLLHHTWGPAIQIFSQGLVRYPKSARLAVGLGLALYWHGQYDDAVKALIKATDLSPTDPNSYYFLSRAYDRAPSQTDDAIERFHRFAGLEPKNAKAVYYYAMSLWKGKQTQSSGADLDQVEALLEKSILLDPSFPDAHLELGNLYSQKREYAKAVPEYQKTLALNPNLPDAYYRLGQAYVHLGQNDLAQKQFQLHQELYNRHLAQVDQEREHTLQFVYSMKSNEDGQQTQ